jgi:hypothetical protein
MWFYQFEPLFLKLTQYFIDNLLKKSLQFHGIE